MTLAQKTASLVFFYFGESSNANRLAQETVPLHLALTGYSKTVLLRHETDVGSGSLKFELSEKAEKLATVLDLPTRENFVKYLDQLGAEGYVVDLFIFSHGLPEQFLVSLGEYGKNALISGKYIEMMVRPLNLRMVWGVNCFGASLNPTWKKLGATVAGGTRHVNFFPTRFSAFVKAWNEGKTYGEALRISEQKLLRGPVHLYLRADAIATASQWGGNVLTAGLLALGKNETAKRYFRFRWLPDHYLSDRSGKENMNLSSRYNVVGDRGTRKA